MADTKDDPKKEIDGIVSSLRRLNREIESTLRPLHEFEKNIDKVGNVIVDKVTDGMIDLYKTSKILSDEQKDLAKNTKSVVEVAKLHQKLGDEILAVREALKKKRITENAAIKKLQDLNIELGDAASDASKLAGKLDELADEIGKVDHEVERFNNTLSTNGARLSKTFDGLRSKVLDSIAVHTTYAGALKLSAKALTTIYDQYVKLSATGLNGVMGTMTLSSYKLRMEMGEFTELIAKNRDIVVSMGAGSEGIEEFVKHIKESSKGLEHLGKNVSYKTAAQIQGALARSGFGPKNPNADVAATTTKNTELLNAQFVRLQGLYGDSAEEFSAFTQELLKGELIQAKLNTKDTKNIGLITQEMFARVEMLRNLGLNNEAILKMNKSLEAMFDPTKNRQKKAREERIKATIGVKGSIGYLRNKGDEKSLELAQLLESNLGNMNRLFAATSNPSLMTDELTKFAAAIGEVQAKIAIDRANDTNAMGGGDASLRGWMPIEMFDQSGPLGAFFKQTFEMLANPANRNLNIQGNDKVSRNAAEATGHRLVTDAMGNLVTETTRLTDAFTNARNVIDGWSSVFDPKNPLTMSLIALTALFFALTKTGRGLLMKGVGGAADMIGGAASKGGKMGMLGKASLVGGNVLGAGLLLNEAHNVSKDESKSDAQKKTAYASLAGSGTGMIAGSLLGQALIPIPVVGALIGGAVGGYAGNIIGDYVGDKAFNKPSDPVAKAKTSKSDPVAKAKTSKGTVANSTTGAGTIASVVTSGSGYIIVRRPDGAVEKVKGDRNWRNNNPGNIEYGDFARKAGAIGSDGRFAIFPSYEIGRKAKESLIFGGKNYKDLSLSSAIARYAPAFENNTGAYQKSVLAAVGGVNKRMSDYSATEREAILNSMQKVEGFKTGTITTLSPPTLAQVSPPPPPAPQPAQKVSDAGSSAPSAQPSDYAMAELKKQTDLLQTIASNSRPSLGLRGASTNDQLTALTVGA